MAMSFKLKDTDLYTLRIAVLVLSPICWATDVSQSDTASLATVRQTVSQIEKDMEFLMTVNYRQTDLRNDILIAVKDMLKCLASRVEKNLMNGLVRLWDFFDPTTPDAETDAFVLNNVSKYFADCGIEVESDTLCNELRAFKLRTVADKKLSHDAYWTGRKLNSPFLSSFVDMLRELLLSEAAVERSFFRFNRIAAFCGLARGYECVVSIGDWIGDCVSPIANSINTINTIQSPI